MELSNLTNHFLIAMPNLLDPNFSKTVTYICAHNEEGTMGITINRPTDMTLGQILNQMELEIQNPAINETQIFNGGPVQTDRGFILHEQGYDWDSTLSVSDDINMTTSKDVLEAIANGNGPKNIFIALGYAGWSSGQLEDEIRQNAWLNGPADSGIIFNTPVKKRWQSAASLLGVDIDSISTDIGHA
mgnify:CR=1 FL=1